MPSNPIPKADWRVYLRPGIRVTLATCAGPRGMPRREWEGTVLAIGVKDGAAIFLDLEVALLAPDGDGELTQRRFHFAGLPDRKRIDCLALRGDDRPVPDPAAWSLDLAMRQRWPQRGNG